MCLLAVIAGMKRQRELLVSCKLGAAAAALLNNNSKQDCICMATVSIYMLGRGYD